MLGVASFGVLEFAGSMLTYFLLLSDAGLELWATREAAQTRDTRALAGRIVPLRFLAALLAAAILFALLPALPDYPQLRILLALFSLSLFAQAANLKWVLMGREQMAGVAGGLVVAQIVFAVAVFAFVRDVSGILWVPVIRFASDAALAAYFAREFAREHGSLRLPLTLAGAGGILRPATIMGATNAMGLLNYNFDAVLLGFLKGTATVGLYNAAYKPVTVALALPLTYFQGLFPALSRFYGEDKPAFRNLVAKSFRLCAVVALPLGVGGTLLALPLIQLLFGSAYAGSAAPLRILVWSAVLVILRGSYRHALNAAGQQQFDFRCGVTSSFLNVGLNILLTPRFGMMGAACATVIGDFIWFVMAVFFFYRRVTPLNPLPHLARPLGSAVVMATILWYAQPIHWIVRALLASACYFAALWLLGEPEVRAWTSRLRAK